MTVNMTCHFLCWYTLYAF